MIWIEAPQVICRRAEVYKHSVLTQIEALRFIGTRAKLKKPQSKYDADWLAEVKEVLERQARRVRARDLQVARRPGLHTGTSTLALKSGGLVAHPRGQRQLRSEKCLNRIRRVVSLE